VCKHRQSPQHLRIVAFERIVECAQDDNAVFPLLNLLAGDAKRMLPRTRGSPLVPDPLATAARAMSSVLRAESSITVASFDVA
jgi:hypothetical protein